MTKENWVTTRIFCFLLFLIGLGMALVYWFTKIVLWVAVILGGIYTILWLGATLWDFADEMRRSHVDTRREK